MPAYFFAIQAVTSFCQGFANTSNGALMKPLVKFLCSLVNVGWSLFCLIYAIIKQNWIEVFAVVGVYIVLCAIGAFVCDWAIKHPPK